MFSPQNIYMKTGCLSIYSIALLNTTKCSSPMEKASKRSLNLSFRVLLRTFNSSTIGFFSLANNKDNHYVVVITHQIETNMGAHLLKSASVAVVKNSVNFAVMKKKFRIKKENRKLNLSQSRRQEKGLRVLSKRKK